MEVVSESFAGKLVKCPICECTFKPDVSRIRNERKGSSNPAGTMYFIPCIECPETIKIKEKIPASSGRREIISEFNLIKEE